MGTDNNYIPEELVPFCVSTSSIRMWGKNPRINDRSAKDLAELIKANMFRDPIEIDQDGVIRAGNTRYKAALILGMKMVPVIRTTYKSEAAAVAYGISNNKASENADWDPEKLMDLMEAPDFDGLTEATGFSQKELDRVKNALAPVDLDEARSDREAAHICPKCGYEFD